MATGTAAKTVTDAEWETVTPKKAGPAPKKAAQDSGEWETVDAQSQAPVDTIGPAPRTPIADRPNAGRYGDYYRMKAGAKLPERTRFTMNYPVFQPGEGVGESLKNVVQSAGKGMFELADAVANPSQTLESLLYSVIPQPLFDQGVRTVEKETKDKPTEENKARLKRARELAGIPNPVKAIYEGMQQPGEFIPEMAGQAAMAHGLKLAPKLAEDFKSGPMSPEKRQAHLANAISETASGSGIDPQTSAKEVEPWLSRAAANNPSVRKVITDSENPVESLKGQYAMNNLAETDIERQYQGVVDRHPNLQTQPISFGEDALALTADPILGEALGKDTTGINDMFRSLNKPHTFAEWDNMRRKLGELAQKTYDSAPGSQSILNQVDALRRAADVVRNGLYDQVQAITGEDLRPLKSAQGKLIEHKWDLWKSIKRVGAEHQLSTGPASSWKSWVAKWTEASGDKGGLGIPGAGHVFKRWKGTTAERIQGNLRNFYRDLPEATPQGPAPRAGQPGAPFSYRPAPTPPGPGLPAAHPPQYPALPGAPTGLAPSGMRGSVEQPAERGIGAPAPQAQLPGVETKRLGPGAPEPFSQTPPVNARTARTEVEPTNLEEAKAKVEKLMRQSQPAPAGTGFTVGPDGEARRVPAGLLSGKAPKVKARKGPAPRKAAVEPVLTPAQQSDAWAQHREDSAPMQRAIKLQESGRLWSESQKSIGPEVSVRQGEKTTIDVGGEDIPAEYVLVEADDMVPSHNPFTYDPNPRYSPGKQTRTYHLSENERYKVEKQVSNHKPQLILSDDPTMTGGPPAIYEDGEVPGGNSRAMAVIRLYSEGKAEPYQTALGKKASQFGLNPEGMRKPVLARRIRRADAPESIVSKMNDPGTMSMDEVSGGIEAGRNVSGKLIDMISGPIEAEGKTLREVMAAKGGDILAELVRSGTIPETKVPAFKNPKTGGLNSSGKIFVEKAFLGRMVDDPEILYDLPDSLKTKLERVAGPFEAIRSRGGKWDITPLIKQAISDSEAVRKSGLVSASDYFRQGNFSDPTVAYRQQLLKLLDMNASDLRSSLGEFAQASKDATQGGFAFASALDPVNVFNDVFKTSFTPEQFAEMMSTIK